MNKGGNRIKVFDQYGYAFTVFLLFEFLLATYRNLVSRRIPSSQRFTKYSTHGETISSESVETPDQLISSTGARGRLLTFFRPKTVISLRLRQNFERFL